MQRACEVCKEMLRRGVANLVAQHSHDRVLVKMYTSDGTPLLLNRAWVRALGVGGRRLRRHGKRAAEYLVERTYVRGRDVNGELMHAALFRDPVPVRDKTGWGLFGCFLQSSPSLRSLGWKGPALSHYVFDRGCYSTMSRMVRQYHKYEGTEELGASAPLIAALDFVFTRPDVLHDCATAFKWGAKAFTESDTAKDLFITIASIRNSYDHLMNNVHKWLPTVTSFKDSDELVPAEVLAQLWRALGVEDDIAEVLVRHRVVWRGERLEVAASSRDAPGFVDELLASLMGVWSFVSFSESRWLSVGASSRAVIASLLTGTESLVRYCRQVKKCSEYYIHGFDRLRPGLRSACAVFAISSAVTEGLLAALMEDDRVMRIVAYLEETRDTELSFVHNIPDACWALVASVTDSDAQELRSKTVYAATVTVAHVQEKIFADTRRHPWVLCRGDKAKNLIDLAAADRPVECVAAQLWDLMQLGYPQECLVEILVEAEGLSWSTKGVEQAHAAAAQVMRHHPDIHQDSMMCRAFLYTVRALFTAAEHATRLAKLEGRISGVKQAKPGQIGGRQMFLAECCELASSLQQGKPLSNDARVELMRSHSQVYKDLDPALRASYARKAMDAGIDKRQALQDQLVALRQDADLLTLRALAETANANPW